MSSGQNIRILNARLQDISRLRGRYIILHISKQNGLIFQHIVNSKYFSTTLKTTASFQFSKEATPLLSNHGSIFVDQRRNISFTWLDNLAISQSKWFQSLSESTAVEKSMTFLQYIHGSLHVPWWLSIIISTVLLRTAVTLPLAIYQHYIFAKVENLRLEMNELMKELGKETAVATRIFKWNDKHAKRMFSRSARRIWKELIIRENCHPFKAAILLWAQIPMWVLLTISLRNMAMMMPRNDINAQIVFAELSTGGFGWMPNLVDVDHSLILPLAMAISNILIVDINESSRNVPRTTRQKYVGYFFKSVSLILIPIAAGVPGNVVLYWTTSSVFGVIQNLILLHPSARRMCGIPSTPSESVKPYQHLSSTLGNKYLFMKRKEQT